MDDVAKGIVQLIREHNIKKLVMGAAADKHFSEGMTDLKSEKALYVNQHAPPSCEIWFVCGGREVHERLIVEPRPSNLRNASCSSYSTCSSILGCNSDLIVSETSDESPDWLESNEVNSSNGHQLCDKLEQALLNAEKSNNDAFEELDRRVKAQKNALKAVMLQARELKISYTGELSRWKETEATLLKQTEELERIKQQRDQARKIAKAQKLLIESQGANSDHIKVLEAKVTSAMEQLQICQRERDELQRKLENTSKQIEENSNKQEETSSVNIPQFFSEYSVAEIHDATEDFDPSYKIAYGRIYKCTLRHTEVAIKVLNQSRLQGPSQFQQEVDIMSKLRHPNLVTLIGVCPEIWALIYEYLPNGSLEDRLSRRDNTPPLSWQTRIHIATEICSALIFLHSTGGWSYSQAAQLTHLALRCCDTNRSRRPDLASEVFSLLEQMRADIGPLTTFHAGCGDQRQIPSYFICPILLEIMSNPHVAADGHTYELRAIQEWLDRGKDTSPKTNNRLAHRHLVPNHTLRSAILEYLQQQEQR
ncbi:hypothetical protein COLO4_12717 [Corchorus olitorius]|uniref:RING-type E3 ubiquitin transferase n=1 Tax=Corchorus olitorius TaxID=93759 RepID=A0A1R3K0A0_9ROSI|nr:hypothetical protein COLO4_12717 [Corchorus olitorius]